MLVVEDECAEILERLYWRDPRNIFVNSLAILIILSNLFLIFVILKSPKLRTQVKSLLALCLLFIRSDEKAWCHPGCHRVLTY